MFTNEAFAFLKSSALVIAGKCVWRSLQSAVKLLPPKVLQSGLSGAIPSLLHKRHVQHKLADDNILCDLKLSERFVSF